MLSGAESNRKKRPPPQGSVPLYYSTSFSKQRGGDAQLCCSPLSPPWYHQNTAHIVKRVPPRAASNQMGFRAYSWVSQLDTHPQPKRFCIWKRCEKKSRAWAWAWCKSHPTPGLDNSPPRQRSASITHYPPRRSNFLVIFLCLSGSRRPDTLQQHNQSLRGTVRLPNPSPPPGGIGSAGSFLSVPQRVRIHM